MAVDYDLVILGGSAVGRYAAWRAVHTQARVALVEPEATLLEAHRFHAVRQAVWTQAIAHSYAARSPMSPPLLDRDIAQDLAWATDVADVYAEGRSLATLAAAGVDVIVGQGEFCRRPRWGVMANGRRLRSRAYLLAPAQTMTPVSLDGWENAVELWTPDSFWMYPPIQRPHRLVIIGGTARGVEMAQTLARLGTQVTVVCDRPTLLPQFDLDLNEAVQSLLEADGVAIWTNTTVKRAAVAEAGTPTYLTLTHPTLPLHDLCADVVVMDAPLQPLLTPLNLNAVELDPATLTVNAYLQTPHPRIFALGLTSQFGDSISEADLAVHNALFLRKRSCAKMLACRTLYTDPPALSLGLTESEARQRYGDRITRLQPSYSSLAAAHIQSSFTGFCKLVVHRNGRLLGAHLLGTGALDTAAAIALLLQTNGKIHALAQSPIPDLGFAMLLKYAAQTWQHQQNGTGRRRDWLEGWFEWLRSWTS